MDLAAYRTDAEAFFEEIEREYLLHFSGRKETYDVEAVYARHGGLFSRQAAERLREAGAPRELVRFAVEGLIGQATKSEAAELARREAETRLHVNGDEIGFRESAPAQANEADPERRAAIERARLDVTEERLNPLLVEAHERAAAIARELGWTSTLAMCEELSGIDLAELGRQARAFLDATEAAYAPLVGPEVERHLGIPMERWRRSDMAAFFRSPAFDDRFPGERLTGALERTAGGLGLSGDGIEIDAEARPTKSPRAFCAPVRVPDEIHLVIAPVGGRDDYEALMHESGHAYHFANTAHALPFEDRCLGDNSVTECYAFLMQHLVSDPAWLGALLDVPDPEPVVRFARAERLVYLRRYCAKLGYELDLHRDGRPPAEHSADYAARLGSALRVDWPRETWLADVDPFFYAARYLRAWAFEEHLRRSMRERFGELWFTQPEAGAVLAGLWRSGQARTADELLAELTGERLDLTALAGAFAGAAA
jgi:hypothetical protein